MKVYLNNETAKEIMWKSWRKESREYRNGGLGSLGFSPVTTRLGLVRWLAERGPIDICLFVLTWMRHTVITVFSRDRHSLPNIDTEFPWTR